MIHFMENSIKESDKVLLIMTPTFKDKVEKENMELDMKHQ